MGDDSRATSRPAPIDPARSRCTDRAIPRDAFVEFTEADTSRPIHSKFESQVDRSRDRLAVDDGSRSLTYGELNVASNRLARAIFVEASPASGAAALLLDHDISAVTGVLGSLKAGKFFVPIDPSLPPERIARVIQDARPGVIVTDSRHLPEAANLSGGVLPVVNVDTAVRDGSGENPAIQVPPESIAYIIYTSGTTGDPKGVIQSHRSALCSVRRSTNGRQICREDRLSLLSRYNTGAGINDALAALLNGAALLLFDVARLGPVALADWLDSKNITVFHAVPTVFRHLAADLGDRKLPSVRLVQLSGEPVYRRDVDLFKQHFLRGCLLNNRFACSEAGVVSQCTLDHDTGVADNLVPIGYPSDDVEVLLLDSSGSEVKTGNAGEIVVCSQHLGPGYWNLPVQTARSFRPAGKEGRPAYWTGDLGYVRQDGCLVHLGRKDSQFEIRGNRVEAGDVERAVLEIPGVRDAAVGVRTGPSGEPHLAAYVVLDAQATWSQGQALSMLRERLPEYMVPSTFTVLESLPLTRTGKVNRQALQAMPETSRPAPDSAPPRTPIERALADIWRHVLGVEEIGIRDDFLALGGHSLAAGRIAARIRDALGVDLPLSTFFETANVESQALLVLSKMMSYGSDAHPRGTVNEADHG